MYQKMFAGISIATVPFIFVSFALLFPLSLMASGASLFWMMFWVPIAALGMSSFTAVIARWLQEHRKTSLQAWGEFWGWLGLISVLVFLGGVLIRMFGVESLGWFLWYMDSYLLGLALISTIYNHMGIIKLFLTKVTPLMWFIWVGVFVTHVYAVLYIFQVVGFLALDAFVQNGLYLWLFIESVLLSLMGTVFLFALEFYRGLRR